MSCEDICRVKLQNECCILCCLQASPKEGVAAAAHRGFYGRAEGIPIEQIFEHALQQGKRLVLSGHSLGGAVATLCAIKLLRQFPAAVKLPLRCICFAMPAIGNHELASSVQQAGWDRYLSNYLLPGEAS